MPTAIEIATQLIQHYEECVLHPYQREGDRPTIGWGNTFWENGTPVTMDDKAIDQARADTLFVFWLTDFNSKIAPHVLSAKPNELAAFLSLAYNIGVNAFLASSALRLFLRADSVAAGNAIELWDKSDDIVLKGLQRRRRAEHLVYDGTDVLAAVAQAEAQFP